MRQIAASDQVHLARIYKVKVPQTRCCDRPEKPKWTLILVTLARGFIYTSTWVKTVCLHHPTSTGILVQLEGLLFVRFQVWEHGIDCLN